MRTCDLTGAALNWAVAKAEGMKQDGVWLVDADGLDGYLLEKDFDGFSKLWSPSHIWSQGGPIIERERIGVYQGDKERDWSAQAHGWLSDPLRRYPFVRGPTPLVAAMRCYVASKLGDNIDIPKELQ